MELSLSDGGDNECDGANGWIKMPPRAPPWSWDIIGKLLAPERASMPKTGWGNGCIGKAGNLSVLGTVLVRFRYHIHEIGEVAVVLERNTAWRCR